MHGAAYQHESWAGLLIALSLMLYRPQRWGASVCLGLAACIFRELALPYLMAMALFALLERRWRELAAWTVSAVLFCVIFAVHISRAAALFRAGDQVSSGWVHFAGLPFALLSVRWNLLLFFAPDAIVAAAVSLSLIGLVGSD